MTAKSALRLPAAAASIALLMTLGGCGHKVQSDLELNDVVMGPGTNKWTVKGRVKNTGDRTYNTVFIALDLYEGDKFFKQVRTSADLFGDHKLEPGQSTSFSQDFEDGGYKPDNFKVARLYATQ